MSDVSTKSDAVDASCETWDKISAILGGTKAMRKAGTAYLPKWSQEEEVDYDFRRDQTTLFNATAKTVGNLAGKPFKEPMTFADTPPDVQAWFENFDLSGRKIDVFALEVLNLAIAYGLTHVLTDYPTGASNATKEQEKVSGARPYAIHVRANQVLGWKSATVGGVETLTQFRYMECVTVDDGEYGSKDIDQIRVLEPGKWSTWQQRQAANSAAMEWYQVSSGTTTRNEIALTTFYTLRTGFMRADSPIEDLADLNIEHWQSSSDQRSILHVARVPILALIGIDGVEDGSSLSVGAKTALKLPSGADAKWVEHSGAAIGAGRTDLLDTEERMRLMGAELLVKGPGRVSATQASLDTAQQQSWLASIAAQFEDFLDQVVESMALWVNIDVTDSHVSVFKDFGVADFDNSAMATILNMRNAGVVSNETAFKEGQRRGLLDQDIEWEDEQARIANEPPVGLGAIGTVPPKLEAPPTVQVQ